jgi:hypothetical protein
LHSGFYRDVELITGSSNPCHAEKNPEKKHPLRSLRLCGKRVFTDRGFCEPVYYGNPLEDAMPDVTRKELQQSLAQDWGTYVERYRALSDDGKRRFVKAQGYARFADILAHFIAWWEEGIKALERMPGDPTYKSPDYSVDEFNAQAVARFAAAGEDEIVDRFETLRKRMARLVDDLPDSAYQVTRITDRLHIEILGHMEEHRY